MRPKSGKSISYKPKIEFSDISSFEDFINKMLNKKYYKIVKIFKL